MLCTHVGKRARQVERWTREGELERAFQGGKQRAEGHDAWHRGHGNTAAGATFGARLGMRVLATIPMAEDEIRRRRRRAR